MKQVILKPRITEKTIGDAESGKYSFEVAAKANKIEVAADIERRYKVNVRNVKVINVKGKTKRFRLHLGKRKDFKKAIVTLKKGQKIAGFEIKESQSTKAVQNRKAKI